LSSLTAVVGAQDIPQAENVYLLNLHSYDGKTGHLTFSINTEPFKSYLVDGRSLDVWVKAYNANLGQEVSFSSQANVPSGSISSSDILTIDIHRNITRIQIFAMSMKSPVWNISSKPLDINQIAKITPAATEHFWILEKWVDAHDPDAYQADTLPVNDTIYKAYIEDIRSKYDNAASVVLPVEFTTTFDSQ